MHAALEIAAWLLALAWALKLLETARGLRAIPNLMNPEYDAAPAGFPRLTVVVPARNEEASIAACLGSLLAQDYGAGEGAAAASLRILAVDDRSTDRTGVIMDGIAAAHPGRIEALHIAELPAGWLGKTHAMAGAARHAMDNHAPEFLLFTDGDILFAPEILRRALAYAVAADADHFVLLPTTILRSRGEAMLLSFLQVMGLWAVRTWKVADPRARDAIGVGAFNLMRAEAYRKLGGFDAMRMEVVEDLALGRRVKRAGMRQRVAWAPGAVRVHWATGVRGILNGMTKNLFAIFRFRPELLLSAVVLFAVFCIAPVALLAAPGARLAALLALTAVTGLYLLSSRTSGISPWYAALFPVSAAMVIYAMLRSMTVTLARGGVTWRGTFYPLRELRAGSKASADRRE